MKLVIVRGQFFEDFIDQLNYKFICFYP